MSDVKARRLAHEKIERMIMLSGEKGVELNLIYYKISRDHGFSKVFVNHIIELLSGIIEIETKDGVVYRK